MTAEEEVLIVTILEEAKEAAPVLEPPCKSTDWKRSNQRRETWAGSWRSWRGPEGPDHNASG
jgi:hypothetical protein